MTIKIDEKTTQRLQALAKRFGLTPAQAAAQMVAGGAEICEQRGELEALAADIKMNSATISTARRCLRDQRKAYDEARQAYIMMKGNTLAYQTAARAQGAQRV